MSAGRRFYLRSQLLELLELPLSTFKTLERTGRLPFLEELLPRLGKHARYRADLVDRYLAGQWGNQVPANRFFGRRTKVG